MRYVVTGAAGFIGSHLAEALLAAGHEVVGIDSFTDYYDPAVKERNASGLDVRRLDLAHEELDFAGWDGVFHLAGQPGVRSFGDVFPLYVERNVLASQRVFDRAPGRAPSAGAARRDARRPAPRLLAPAGRWRSASGSCASLANVDIIATYDTAGSAKMVA